MAVSEKSILDEVEKSHLLEELKRERENNNPIFNTRYSHKEDLENLLKLAEELKDKCNEAKTSIRNYRILQIIFALSLLLWTFIGLFYFSIEPTYLVIIIGILSSTSIIFSFQYFVINDFRKQYFYDKVALLEVLQLLRETSNIIAEQEDWSVLSRAEFRIRLSRFNLEEEKIKSAFNSFSWFI